MPIVPSRAREIQKLLAQLGGGEAARREAAVARLTLLGERSVEPLLAWLRTASADGRLQALAVLSRLHDSRALPEILALAKDPHPEVARRAVELAAEYPSARTAQAVAAVLAGADAWTRRAAVASLARLHRAGVVEALDPLLDLLLDEDQDESLRLQCLEAVAHLGRRELRPLLKRLVRYASRPALTRRAAELAGGLEDASPPASLAREVKQLGQLPVSQEEAALEALAGQGLVAADALIEALLAPSVQAALALRIGKALRRFDLHVLDRIHRALARAETPLALRVLAEASAEFKAPASIPALHRALERLNEQGAGSSGAIDAIAETKARIHSVLASLGSRIALYDLREMLEARPPRALPTLLGAAERIGDATVVPALAGLVAEDASNLDPCAAALAAIVRRERLRRTSRALKSVRPERRHALDALWARASAR